MNGHQRATAAVALFGSMAATFVLHTSMERADVARVVPVALAWGAAVFLMARGAPSLRATLTVAALVRVVVVGSPTGLSDDVYRYLWEGQALLAGHNPLYVSPSALMAMDPGLAPTLGPLVNHPELPSVYPPLAMAWFVALAGLGGTVGVAQLATALVDVAIVASLYRCHASSAWLYALLPLPVLESAAGAHIDVPAAALTLLGVMAYQRAAPRTGWALMVAGLLTKLFPLVLLPTAWRRAEGRNRTLLPFLGIAAVLLVALPFVKGTIPPGLVAYGTRWSFNGLAHVPLHALVGDGARPLLVGVGAVVGLAVVWKARDLFSAWAGLGIVFVVLTPTMHPWYLVWALLPTLALGRREVAAAAVFLPSSYAVLATWDASSGTWDAGPWLWACTWGPALAAAGATWAWDRRATLLEEEGT